MRFLTIFFLAATATSSVGWTQGQEAATTTSVSETSGAPTNVYVVQLTEFRMKRASDVKMTAGEIIKEFEEKKDKGDIEIVETIRMSTLANFESMVQVGRKVTVVTGVMNAPGRAPVRQMQNQMVGTMVRLTAEPRDSKTMLRLSYEASRLDGEGEEDIPPDIKTFQIETSLLVDPAKLVLVGGSNADSTSYLVVSVTSAK